MNFLIQVKWSAIYDVKYQFSDFDCDVSTIHITFEIGINFNNNSSVNCCFRF